MKSSVRRSHSSSAHLLGTTRGKILLQLCRGRRTVNELAAHLHLTDNAVRAQLERLIRDGYAVLAGERPGVRKPHAEYELAIKAKELFPRAYEPALGSLLDVLGDELSAEKVKAVLAATARRLIGEHLGTLRARGAQQRLSEILTKLNGAGSGIDVTRKSGAAVVSSCICPLASVTARHPEVCESLAAVLSDVVGSEVHEICDRRETPQCRFELRDHLDK